MWSTSRIYIRITLICPLHLDEITRKIKKSKISPLQNVNHLGVFLDECLSCDAHVNYLCKKESTKSRAWGAYVLPCLPAWRACVCACVLVLMKCFIFLRVCVLGALFCFTFQYLNLKILTAKNVCALLSWTYFLFTFWYQLIKLFETSLRVAGKSIDISCSYSFSKGISIF